MLKIVQSPDPLLNQVCEPCETGDRSLKKLAVLPPETKVYPGHGPATTIGDELRLNPYIIRLKK